MLSLFASAIFGKIDHQASIADAPERIIVGNDPEDGTYVDGHIPRYGQFEYIRADLVEKLKDE